MSDRSKALIEWVTHSIEQDSGELPVFPSIAMRLVDLLESPDVEISEAALMISQDQVIASKILRTANSALYLGASPVETVSAAVMRVGFRESTNIAMAAACRSLFDMEDRAELEVHPLVWGAIWNQSLVCAYGGRSIARELGVGDPEQIFLGALMRHVGCLLVLKVIARGLVRGRLTIEPSEEELEEAFHRLQIPVGVDYLRQSRLPEVFIAAAADGLDPSLSGILDGKSLEILRLADGLADVISVAPFARGELGRDAERSVVSLGIDENRLEYLTLQFQSMAEQVQSIL